jgi:hypothetical protein
MLLLAQGCLKFLPAAALAFVPTRFRKVADQTEPAR